MLANAISTDNQLRGAGRSRGRRVSTTSEEVSLNESRRISLAARGFEKPRPGTPIELRDLDRRARSPATAWCSSTSGRRGARAHPSQLAGWLGLASVAVSRRG
jgi:hypothetical protein